MSKSKTVFQDVLFFRLTQPFGRLISALPWKAVPQNTGTLHPFPFISTLTSLLSADDRLTTPSIEFQILITLRIKLIDPSLLPYTTILVITPAPCANVNR